MCLTVISVVVIYFFYPETKQLSLEELASRFGETVIDPALEKSRDGDASLPGEKNDTSIDRAERMG